jgi:6-phosphofructokinase 1
VDDKNLNFNVQRLGECRIPSPISNIRFVDDSEHVLYHSNLAEIEHFLKSGGRPPEFEKAGPREKIYFDPSKLKCGIVTCGGICPGLNDVIRAIVRALHFHYNTQTIFGFPFGYEGLSYKYGHAPIDLTPAVVDDIHQKGGSILGSSRGPQDISDMVDCLERMSIGLLFTIGGDGTLRGARAIAEEIANRNLKIGVIGIPKTIDNDISYVERSFGFLTAVSEATNSIYAAHTEAEGARNGIGLVKLMGRESGFIAANACLANSSVNFCLIPEVRFTLESFAGAVKERLEKRNHAVIVVGEGAGQDLMAPIQQHDASGNVRLGDIGKFLKEQLTDYLKNAGTEITLKYIDPSYNIRSMPANANDSAFSLLLGHHAAHAGMAGRTNMVVGYWKNEFTHVPIQAAVSERKKIDTNGWLWNSVLVSTGQPRKMV